MRKLLAVLFVIIALCALWLWRGRDLSMLLDRFHVIETSSRPIKSIAYEGGGTGGILHLEDLALSLNEVELGRREPRIGTTKDNQLALSFNGNIFPFGPPSGSDALAAIVSADDVALVVIQHSAIGWPNFFEFNFMTGKTPTWKRNIYQKLAWKKPSGARLEMLWRYEQYFYPGDGWVQAFMTRPGSTGLIQVDISTSAR